MCACSPKISSLMDDWPAAAGSYASARDAYFSAERTVGQWAFDLLFQRGSGADQRREHALPLLAAEPDRFPDHFFSGPELPCDDNSPRTKGRS